VPVIDKIVALLEASTPQSWTRCRRPGGASSASFAITGTNSPSGVVSSPRVAFYATSSEASARSSAAGEAALRWRLPR
jgi:hypothetical protein